MDTSPWTFAPRSSHRDKIVAHLIQDLPRTHTMTRAARNHAGVLSPTAGVILASKFHALALLLEHCDITILSGRLHGQVENTPPLGQASREQANWSRGNVFTPERLDRNFGFDRASKSCSRSFSLHTAEPMDPVFTE